MSDRPDLPRCLYWLYRWFYRGGRPGQVARSLNRRTARQFAAGLRSRPCDMTLEVRGRQTGRVIALPVVVADYQGRHYLVSMLGEAANWVKNVRAAQGRAVLTRQRSRHVRLDEVPTTERAPILRRYLEVAPGARPHIPLDLRAPLTEYEKIASRYPVFRIADDNSPTQP
jgi:deazaflavin-dependent oxidoreductase (nitroreductase family)